MATTEANQGQAHPEAAAFISKLIDTAARERLPDLFSGDHPDALYRVPDRNGVSVLVVRTPQLSEEHLVKLMKYRLAQYLAVNFVDTDMIYAARMEYEPLSGVSPHDVHLIAGFGRDGRDPVLRGDQGGHARPWQDPARPRSTAVPRREGPRLGHLQPFAHPA